MVPSIYIRGDEGGSFRIGSGNGQIINSHDIILETNCDETVNMFLDRNQHFSSHVTTLLRPRRLIFDVNPSSTLFNEQLGEFHHSSQTTMASICIRNNGAEIVNV